MGRLRLENVSKSFASRAGSKAIVAVEGFSLEVPEGKLTVLLGPSGSGKTTLLRLIAGLETPTGGRIMLDDRELQGVPPHERPIGMAFQYPALLPQLSVRGNIALGPKLRGVAAAETERRTGKLGELLQLTDLLDRSPETLSGGQQQRVSLARALANEPAILLLDEPLANLDPISRSELRDGLRRVQRELGLTTIYVTHDQNEAAALGDEIAITRAGVLQQVGPAPVLYRDPVNLFVAEFFGPERPNVFPCSIREGRVRPDGAEWSFEAGGACEGTATCVLRAETLRPEGSIKGRVREAQHTGWNTRLVIEVEGLCLRVEVPFTPEIGVGTPFFFTVREFLLFDRSSGIRLRA